MADAAARKRNLQTDKTSRLFVCNAGDPSG
jgi:hypothetical protein